MRMHTFCHHGFEKPWQPVSIFFRCSTLSCKSDLARFVIHDLLPALTRVSVFFECVLGFEVNLFAHNAWIARLKFATGQAFDTLEKPLGENIKIVWCDYGLQIMDSNGENGRGVVGIGTMKLTITIIRPVKLVPVHREEKRVVFGSMPS